MGASIRHNINNNNVVKSQKVTTMVIIRYLCLFLSLTLLTTTTNSTFSSGESSDSTCDDKVVSPTKTETKLQIDEESLLDDTTPPQPQPQQQEQHNKMSFSSILRGKVALITGGGGTIGEAIASKLVGQGASVVLVGRTMERLEKARARVLKNHNDDDDNNNNNNNHKVSIFSCDVTKEESVTNLFTALDKQYSGGVDLLINNAGVAINGETDTLSGDDFDWVMKVNVLGPFLCAREALKRMKQKRGGRIINIGSISAISPRPNSAPYTTSKFAVMGLTQSLALDARPYNVAVGMIHPGNVVSAIMSPEEAERREKEEGFLQPDDVANCVLTMASLPYSANVLEMTVIPTRQPLVGRG